MAQEKPHDDVDQVDQVDDEQLETTDAQPGEVKQWPPAGLEGK